MLAFRRYDPPEVPAAMPRPSRDALFRPEAIQAGRSNFGSPLDTQGSSSWLLTALALALAIVIGIALSTAHYTRRETVSGTLAPETGSQNVTALRSGVVTDVFVREGQQVSSGGQLFRVSYETTDARGQPVGAMMTSSTIAQAASAASQGEAKLASIAAQISSINERIRGLRRTREQLVADKSFQNERVRLASETVVATRQLFDQQLIAAVQMRQREEALIVARQQLGNIEREIGLLESEIAQAEAQKSQLYSEREQQTAANRQIAAQLDEKRIGFLSQQGEMFASRLQGSVAALSARPGRSVRPGETLAVIMPAGGKLVAELWVPSRAAGFLAKGDQVRLMYDAFPFQRFGIAKGEVVAISLAPTLPGDLPTPIETKEALYRVVVRLERQNIVAYGKTWRLAPGMRLEADLILDRRPFLSWIFEPLAALRARL